MEFQIMIESLSQQVDRLKTILSSKESNFESQSSKADVETGLGYDTSNRQSVSAKKNENLTSSAQLKFPGLDESRHYASIIEESNPDLSCAGTDAMQNFYTYCKAAKGGNL